MLARISSGLLAGLATLFLAAGVLWSDDETGDSPGSESTDAPAAKDVESKPDEAEADPPAEEPVTEPETKAQTEESPSPEDNKEEDKEEKKEE